MALYGYLVVTAVFAVYIFVAGFINSFGVFVDQFDRSFCQPNDCLDILALVSALALANYRLLCWLVVILERRISSVTLFLIGLLLCIISMISTSYISSLTQLFITHSLLYGFGSTLMLNSPLSVIESYFPKRHPRHVLTTSIMNLGSPIGVVVMNPLAVYLDEHEAHSWRDTLKILGGAIAVSGFFYLATLIRPYILGINDSQYEDLDEKNNLELVEEKKESWFTSLLAVFNPLSTTWILGLYLVSSGIFIPKTLFMQYMTNTKNITGEDAALVMSLSGVAEASCSFLISIIGDYLSFHILSIYVGGSALLSIGCYLLQYATSWTHIAIYSIMHGAIDGFLMTVLFSVVRHVTTDSSQSGTMWSLTNLAVGLGQLTGLPIAGFLFDKYRTYDRVFEFASLLFLGNTLMFLITYIVRLFRIRCTKLPDHASKLQAAPSYDEPFEELDDSAAPLAKNHRPKTQNTLERNPPAPNIAP